MKDRLSSQSRGDGYVFWETIFDYGADQTINTLTPLLAFTDLGSDYRAMGVFLQNTGANSAHLIVEVSHGGTVAIASNRQEKVIAVGKEDYIEIGEPNPFTYVRVSSQTDSPGFPDTTVKWALIGLRR